MAKAAIKALFVGMGSIGTRHLNNLAQLCAEKGIALQAAALRATDAALPQASGQKLYAQWRQLPQGEYFDIAFITNPTHLHAQALQELNGRVHAFFIEKPIFESKNRNLKELGLLAPQKAYVAAPMRHTALYARLKAWLKTQKVYSARLICSSYLPSWRPGQNHSQVYSAKRHMGGGTALDLIHELDYMVDLFGLPQKCFALHGKYSQLEIDSDDISVYIAKYAGHIAEMHLDYFGREYRRNIELFCENGTAIANFASGQLRLPDGSEIDCSEDANQRYIEEMNYFIGYALGSLQESINSPEKALQVLGLALS